MIVVDTNILAHFWLPSDQSQKSDLVFNKDSDWVAPILWKSEFRNVVTLYLRKKLIDITQAILIMEKVERQMRDHQFEVNSIQILDLVYRSNCSAYDCEFVGLAKDLNTKLITLDKSILREFPDLALHPDAF
ncbi:MAG TPA: VapC toxin family PIN domain ribonuclease [Bacteroidetes bacterium]|nr:VapC toxin family PIN domain ribonuclease [Bacteroidota bacterium]